MRDDPFRSAHLCAHLGLWPLEGYLGLPFQFIWWLGLLNFFVYSFTNIGIFYFSGSFCWFSNLWPAWGMWDTSMVPWPPLWVVPQSCHPGWGFSKGPSYHQLLIASPGFSINVSLLLWRGLEEGGSPGLGSHGSAARVSPWSCQVCVQLLCHMGPLGAWKWVDRVYTTSGKCFSDGEWCPLVMKSSQGVSREQCVLHHCSRIQLLGPVEGPCDFRDAQSKDFKANETCVQIPASPDSSRMLLGNFSGPPFSYL